MAEENEEKLSVPESPCEITMENAHLVDFDNLKVRMICLVSTTNVFTNITNFLKRRGWEILYTDDLTEALSQVGIFKPDFVLVSINHAHKKIRQFPQIVTQTFNVPTIVYGEMSDAKTISNLQSVRASYKIMGHLSGPTLQRKIKKILLEKFSFNEESEDGPPGVVINPVEYNTSSGKMEQRVRALKFSGRKYDKGSLIFEKNQSKMKSAAAYKPNYNGQPIDQQSTGDHGSAYDPTKPKDYGVKKESTKQLSVAKQIKKNNHGVAALRELDSSSESEESNAIESIDRQDSLTSKKIRTAPSEDAETGSKHKQSFIEKATISVVNRMRIEENENSSKLGSVRRLGVLSVEHHKHKGYFMIAGHEMGIELDSFVHDFINQFIKLCVDSGESIELGDYINMDCPGYDFFDNTDEGFEFNLVTNFGTGEVGIKFIHDEEALAHAETNEDHDKAKIKTEQLVEDKALPVDLFVHLKQNKKYYKIVSKDSELSKERKEKLTSKKTEVFINKQDVSAYRSSQTKHKASLVINRSVMKTTKKFAS